MRAATEYHIHEDTIPPLSVMIVKGQEDLSIKVRQSKCFPFTILFKKKKLSNQ